MTSPSLLDARDRQRLRHLALEARGAFPEFDWATARHMSRASVAYIAGDDDAPHSDPTGAFCDAVSPDVLLALLGETE